MSNINYSSTTPAAPSGSTNVHFQTDGTNVSGYIPNGSGLVIGFVITVATPGSNVGPMLPAPSIGSVTKCVVATKASDFSTALSFTIRQNGTSVFSTNPSVAAGTSAGTVLTVGTLTSTPLNIAAGDVFSIDILTGSATWQFTAQLE